MLSKCIDHGNLVGAISLTVFHQLFWNFADVFCMEWRCAFGFGILLWLFFSLFLLCELSLFFLHEVLSKCIDSGYLVGATPLTVFHRLLWNFADVFCMKWRCACCFGIILWLFFLTLSLFFFFFYMKWVPCGCNSSYSFALIVLKLCRCFLHGMKMCMWF